MKPMIYKLLIPFHCLPLLRPGEGDAPLYVICGAVATVCVNSLPALPLSSSHLPFLYILPLKQNHLQLLKLLSTVMSSHATVHVSGIAPGTTEKEVRDFFSFWYANELMMSNKTYR